MLAWPEGSSNFLSLGFLELLSIVDIVISYSLKAWPLGTFSITVN